LAWLALLKQYARCSWLAILTRLLITRHHVAIGDSATICTYDNSFYVTIRTATLSALRTSTSPASATPPIFIPAWLAR
jgi:hypothetical protein